MLLQSFSYVLRLLHHLYAYYRYSGCHAKIGNFNAENSMCPILPLNKSYLRNYLEPTNYLAVPELQDDIWSGKRLSNTLLGGYMPSRKKCVLGSDGTRRVTFSQRRGRHLYGQPTRATLPRTHVYSQA